MTFLSCFFHAVFEAFSHAISYAAFYAMPEFGRCLFCGIFLGVFSYYTLWEMNFYGKKYHFSVDWGEQLIVCCGQSILAIQLFMKEDDFFLQKGLEISRIIAKNEIILTICLVAHTLILMGWVDFRCRKIPNEMNRNLCLLACILLFLQGMNSQNLIFKERILGVFLLSLPMMAINFFYPVAFGVGDVKLVAGAGFLLGYSDLFLAAFLGTSLASLVCIYLLFRRQISRKETIAFGPYLCGGILFIFLYRYFYNC